MSLVRGLKLWERPDERKISLYGLYTTGRDLLDWYHFSRRERGAYELARDAREGAMARRAASEDAPADIEDGYT